MKKYIGSNMSEFILSNVDISVNVGDVIYPSENNRLKCKVNSVYDNGIAVVLQKPDTYVPNKYFEQGVDWVLVD